MYTTRLLSVLRKYPELVSEYPEAPSSGYLVIQDGESETYSCFGLCKNRTLKQVPFPQNKELTVRYAPGSTHEAPPDSVFFIPVLNQPLYRNRYYAIVPHGKHKGKAFTCSREEDRSVVCCFCRCISDVKPREFNPQNIYQQFEIVPCEAHCNSRGDFTAKSIASDGFPPLFLRQERWTINTRKHKHFELGEAKGLDCTLRARLSQLVASSRSESLVVGKWHCPFMFFKDGRLRDQLARSMYYEMTLEQRWERIFSCQNIGGNSVAINVSLEKEVVFVNGNKGVMDERNATMDGVVWFTSSGNLGGETSFGLRIEVLQRMKWEQQRGGWTEGGDHQKEAMIKRTEAFSGVGGWSEFGCYVLVERFRLKRMDGSLAMDYDFKHFHHIRALWE